MTQSSTMTHEQKHCYHTHSERNIISTSAKFLQTKAFFAFLQSSADQSTQLFSFTAVILSLFFYLVRIGTSTNETRCSCLSKEHQAT